MSFPDSIVLKHSEIIRTDTTQVLPLGTRGTTKDGRVFRYCKAGGAIAAGRLVQMEAGIVLATVPQTSNLLLATEYQTTVGTSAVAIGVKVTHLADATAIVADNYKEGLLYIGGTSHPTGSGQSFTIKSHTGITASSTSYIVFTLEDNEHPEASFTTDVAVGFRKNTYDDVIQVVQAAEPTAPVVGIAQCAFASGDYGWLQTWGKGMAYVGGATTARANLVAATDAALTGLAVCTSGTTLALNNIVAIAPEVIVAGGYAPVDIVISP